MIRFARLTSAVCLVSMGLLAACVTPITTPSNTKPPARIPDTGTDAVAERSAASKEMSRYYARIQQNYVTRGLLRVDGGGPDTPFNQRQLVENFVKIALHEEFSTVGGRIVRQENETNLHRWSGPVRMNVVFGDSVPIAQRESDTASVAAYTHRLSKLTRLPFRLTDQNPNYHVFIVNEDERKTLGTQLRAISGDIDEAAVQTVEAMSVGTLCLVFAIDSNEDGLYNQAVAVIRAEHPDLLRLSCIHEEIPQGLGLPNDSPAARPSVFNDDEEFGLLTNHDELLLRMLYDPRLRPGMNSTQARPIAQQIAMELLGGES